MFTQEERMPDTIILSRNKAALDRCNKIYKWIFIAVAAPVLAAVAYSIFEMFISILFLNLNALFAFLICGVILPPISGTLIIYSGYVRQDIFAYTSPLPLALGVVFDVLLGDTGVVSVLVPGLMIVIILIVPTVLANSKYRYLEDQEGFPHFSPLLIEQLKRSDDLKKHDPYAEAAERRKLTQSDSMNDLELNGEVIEDKVNEKTNYMDEI